MHATRRAAALFIALQRGAAALHAVSRAAPAEIGAPLASVATPALLLDLDAFERNCALLKASLAGSGVTARPHVKAHKSGALGARTLELLGDVGSGVCAQTLAEAEAALDAGVKDVLLTNEVAGAGKVARLRAAADARPEATVGALVDDRFQIAALDDGFRGRAPLDVYVEVDVGQARCGAAPGAAAADLAAAVDSAQNLRLAGAHCYNGITQHIRVEAERRAAVLGGVADGVRATKAAFRARGLPAVCVTGGGTGTYLYEAESGEYDEVQPGSFCIMDSGYLANEGGGPAFERALSVLSTVVSAPAPGRAVVDAGSKAIDLVSGPPDVAAAGAIYNSANGGDEHGVLLGADDDLAVGDLVYLLPAHCDPTVALHDFWVCHRGGFVEDVLPIARGW